MICQQVTLSGDAEWPKVADTVIEAGIFRPSLESLSGQTRGLPLRELLLMIVSTRTRLPQGFSTALCYLTYLVSLAMSFLVDLAVRPIWTDEALSYYQVSAKTLLEMLDSFNSGVNAIPYLYFIVLWGIDQGFGLGPVILRLPSAVFALAALFLFHTILKERFGNAVAFVSCVAALLLSENFIPFSHEARPYSLYVLVAVCCLYASITILKEGAGRGRALLINSVVAFTLPAVHYVGLFYSFGAALAVLCVGRVKGKFFTLRVLGSFVFGWAVFFVLHYSQMKLFIEKKGMIDATWIPRRSLREAYYSRSECFDLASHHFRPTYSSRWLLPSQWEHKDNQSEL